MTSLKESQPRQVRIIHLQNDELKKCSNAWRPRIKSSCPETDPEMLQTEDLLRKVRAILNKLTPERFDRLVEQVLELKIDSKEKLSGVVDLVFEKAVDEPSFSVMYGQLCHRLAHLKVQMAEKAGSTVTFRTLLLRRCQKEFDVERSDDVVLQMIQEKLDSSASPTERERLQEELEDVKSKARRRSVGLVKLIGELFKLKMLTAAIIFSCTFRLLKRQDEDSLQQLCTLLTTVGKELDANGAKPQMDQLFNQMAKLIKERQTSTRIRFMLQDVVALKENNWVPRKADQGPKTILQVHKEAEMEQREEQLQTMKQLFSKDDWRPARTSLASQYRNEETSSTAPTRLSIPREIPRISRWPQSDEEIQLRPQGLALWARGCRGWNPAGHSETRVSKTAGPKPDSVLPSAPLSRLSTPPARPRHGSAGKKTDMKQRHSETSETERNRFEPLKAMEPVEPLKPVEQVEPVVPVGLVEPVEPLQPVEQVERLEPTECNSEEPWKIMTKRAKKQRQREARDKAPMEGNRVKPVKAVEPVEPLKPVERVEPVQTVKPLQAVEQVEPVQPMEPAERNSEEPRKVKKKRNKKQRQREARNKAPMEENRVEPVKAVEPVEPVQPVEQVEPVEPVEPLQPVEPVEPLQPVEQVEATEPLEPVCLSLFQATVEECQLNSSSFMRAGVRR